MKILKIVIVMLILIASVGAVCAADAYSDDALSDDNQEIFAAVHEDGPDALKTSQEDVYSTDVGSFSDLREEIKTAGSVLNITRDYKFNGADNNLGVLINKTDFVINGNGHTLDGDHQSRIFISMGNNITINNLKLVNSLSDEGAAVYIFQGSSLTTNNVTFDNGIDTMAGAAVGVQGDYTSINDKFINNYAQEGSAIFANGNGNTVNIINGTFVGGGQLWGSVYLANCMMLIENTTFADISSNYSSAIFLKNSMGKIKNCNFVNLTATMTAGAIGIKSLPGEIIIEGCTFINASSKKNGGAVFADVPGESGMPKGNLSIINSRFVNCSSGFGGACLQLGGQLTIDGSNFTSNHVDYDGGAIYTSSVEHLIISNSRFISNEGVPDYSYGGACYLDNGNVTLDSCVFENNSALEGSSFYAFDCALSLSNNLFNNPLKGSSSIFTVFDRSYSDIGNNFTDDVVSLNNTDYNLNVEGLGNSFVIINNTIDVAKLPSRFDLREWGWVSSVKNQGDMGACWTFGATGALESVLIRYANITYDFSENNLQDLMLSYSRYGDTIAFEGGNTDLSIGYFISWIGPIPFKEDTFDQLGKISPVYDSSENVYILNLVTVPPRKNSTDNDLLKRAIVEYGSLAVGYCYDPNPLYYNSTTYAYYYNESGQDHMISVVGWDDNFAKENFVITPPDNGAWICKNSWGTTYGDEGFFYISYYDTSFVTVSNALTFILDDVKYDYLYQHETCYGDILDYTYYKNVFVAEKDTLIEAVGTFFNASNVEYEFSVAVNDKILHVQKGVSEHMGYSTIKLDKYVPIKKGDVFTITFKNNSTAYGSARFHVRPDSSFVSYDGEKWIELSANNQAAILKVYTLDEAKDVIDNNDISVDYTGAKYFSVKVVTADWHVVVGEDVKFTINGKTTPVTTDSNGIAKIKITQTPGKYSIKTTCNGKTYTNKITVKHVITTSKVTVKKTAKKFTLKATLKINGKLQKGKTVTFNLNGKTYQVKTNAKGVAQKTLKKSVINKLKKGKTYTVKVTYLKDTIKSTVKVK